MSNENTLPPIGSVVDSMLEDIRPYLLDPRKDYPEPFYMHEFNGIPVSPAKGDRFTLNYNQIIGYTRSDRDYEVTVVKVDGPKVWLTTGSGEGFIVKK